MLQFLNIAVLSLLIIFYSGTSCNKDNLSEPPAEPPPADVGVRVIGYTPRGGCPSGPYGVFLIDEAGVVKFSKKGTVGGLNFIHCGDVPSGNYYLALLISIHQNRPIEFEPESGDYLGYYKADGDSVTLQPIKPPTIYTVYLELVP